VAVITAIFTGLAIILTEWIIPFKVNDMHYGGLTSVFLATLAISYPLIDYLKSRDREELQDNWSEPNLLYRHGLEIMIYVFGCFITSTIVFSLAAHFLGQDFFQVQVSVLENIRGEGSVTGDVTSATTFWLILINNLMVYFATFALSFFISSGMVFITLWNASVLGVLVGLKSSSLLHIPFKTFPYLIHGTVEIGGFITAGLAGTLLAYNLEHYILQDTHHAGSFRQLLKDGFILLIIGVGMIFFAASIETGYMP
jgi:uncharacterized membrane protein SpoIIM required for sporulation